MTTTEAPARGPWAMPDARKVLRYDATREDWLAARRQGLGGSDAAAVLGLSPYVSPYELYLEKTDQLIGDVDNEAMEWGRRLEPVVAEWFTDSTGIAVRREGLLQSRERPWQQVSLDRSTEDGGILECKTLSWRVESSWDESQVPDAAELQVQHALAVTGRSHGWVAALVDGRRPKLRRVERDERLIADLIAVEADFWQLIVDRTPPPIDDTESTAEALRKLYPVTAEGIGSVVDAEKAAELVQAKRAADLAVKEAEAAQRLADSLLRAAIGEAELLITPAGHEVATLRQNGTFSPKRFTEAEPELAEEYRRLTPGIDSRRLAADHPEIYTRYRARVLRIPKEA